MSKIRIGIWGYDDLGREVEQAISKFPDLELVRIFSSYVLEGETKMSELGTEMVSDIGVIQVTKDIDVMVMCGGTEETLSMELPAMSLLCNTVDGINMGRKSHTYFKDTDRIAKKTKTTAVLSASWESGVVPTFNVYSSALLEEAGDGSITGNGACVNGLTKNGLDALVLLTLARAAYRMSRRCAYGAFTMFDIPPKLLSSMSNEELRTKYL